MPVCARSGDMPVFLVTPLSSNADQLGSEVKRAFTEDARFELQSRAGWFGRSSRYKS